LQKEIELMRAGAMGTHELRTGRIVDTTDDSIEQRLNGIAAMEQTISKLEAMLKGMSALWGMLNRRSISTALPRELQSSVRAQLSSVHAQMKSLGNVGWSRWGSAGHARPRKRTARHRPGQSRSRANLRPNGPD
jgi:DNA mismatch repair ATPase MutS